MKATLLRGIVGLVFATLPANASAITIDLIGSGPVYHGFNSYSFHLGGVMVTFQALPADATLTFNNGGSGADGLGIRYSYENDEIERPESVAITFSTLVTIDRIHVTDFFKECRPGTCYRERGSYAVGGSPATEFVAPVGNLPWPATNGQMTVDIGIDARPVDTFVLTAPGKVKVWDNGGWRWQDHEYSLAAVDFTPVPEPGTLFMLAAGLGGMAVARKRRRKD